MAGQVRVLVALVALAAFMALMALMAGAGGAMAGQAATDPRIPVYPAYPYRAGYYPTADSYHDLPPYAAISPSWYRKRYFLTFRERNRYRYMPHIFRGNDGSYVK
jgi:hypothetical protein